MGDWEFTKGLHELGNGLFAYLQPDGSWGFSNAGLITDGDASLLVDTLYDLKHTAEMLETMRAAVPAASKVGVLVNTHANADHCWGNQLVAGAEIVATRACAEEMMELQPAMLQTLLAGAGSMGKVGEFAQRIFGRFDFDGITLTPPTTTFDGERALHVGGKEVRLFEVGPAHTRGDLLVYVPAHRTVFTGDIVFANAHPVMWAGPSKNWVGACDRILAMDVDVVVPGHGPISDKHAVEELRGYWLYLTREARLRLDAGLSPLDAARDISMTDYAAWGEAERLVANISMLYREFSGESGADSSLALLTQMAELAVA